MPLPVFRVSCLRLLHRGINYLSATSSRLILDGCAWGAVRRCKQQSDNGKPKTNKQIKKSTLMSAASPPSLLTELLRASALPSWIHPFLLDEHTVIPPIFLAASERSAHSLYSLGADVSAVCTCQAESSTWCHCSGSALDAAVALGHMTVIPTLLMLGGSGDLASAAGRAAYLGCIPALDALCSHGGLSIVPSSENIRSRQSLTTKSLLRSASSGKQESTVAAWLENRFGSEYLPHDDAVVPVRYRRCCVS